MAAYGIPVDREEDRGIEEERSSEEDCSNGEDCSSGEDSESDHNRQKVSTVTDGLQRVGIFCGSVGIAREVRALPSSEDQEEGKRYYRGGDNSPKRAKK